MEVILLADLQDIGQRGEVKNVSPGFARNYLIPRKLATLATPDLREKIQKEKERKAKEVQKRKIETEELLSSLKGLKVSFREKASEEGTLFSGITKEKIAQKVREVIGQAVSENNIILEKPIKQKGEHSVILRINNKDYPIDIEIR